MKWIIGLVVLIILAGSTLPLMMGDNKADELIQRAQQQRQQADQQPSAPDETSNTSAN